MFKQDFAVSQCVLKFAERKVAYGSPPNQRGIIVINLVERFQGQGVPMSLKMAKRYFKIVPIVSHFERDNDRDNRVAAKRLVVSGADDKIGVSQSSAEHCFHEWKPRLRFIVLLYSLYPFRAVLPRHQEAAECDGGL